MDSRFPVVVLPEEDGPAIMMMPAHPSRRLRAISSEMRPSILSCMASATLISGEVRPASTARLSSATQLTPTTRLETLYVKESVEHLSTVSPAWPGQQDPQYLGPSSRNPLLISAQVEHADVACVRGQEGRNSCRRYRRADSKWYRYGPRSEQRGLVVKTPARGRGLSRRRSVSPLRSKGNSACGYLLDPHPDVADQSGGRARTLPLHRCHRKRFSTASASQRGGAATCSTTHATPNALSSAPFPAQAPAQPCIPIMQSDRT